MRRFILFITVAQVLAMSIIVTTVHTQTRNKMRAASTTIKQQAKQAGKTRKKFRQTSSVVRDSVLAMPNSSGKGPAVSLQLTQDHPLNFTYNNELDLDQLNSNSELTPATILFLLFLAPTVMGLVILAAVMKLKAISRDGYVIGSDIRQHNKNGAIQIEYRPLPAYLSTHAYANAGTFSAYKRRNKLGNKKVGPHIESSKITAAMALHNISEEHLN